MQSAVFDSTDAMTERGLTNGLVQIEPLELFASSDAAEWTTNQKNVIAQGNMFHGKTNMTSMAERVPWQFRLKYRELSTGREGEGKVLAWSYYVGFMRERDRLGNEQAAIDSLLEKIRGRIFSPKNRVYCIFGTHSRFGNWMISAIYHIPNQIAETRKLI